MAGIDVERLGAHLDSWVQAAPNVGDLDALTLDAQKALIEAGMVQYKADGWDFKLHEKHPDAPRAQFKLMIREHPGVDTNPAYYDRFTLPSVLEAGDYGRLDGVKYVLGYPKAGTPIAGAFVRLAKAQLGVELAQLEQAKIEHADGTRQLGDITTEYIEGEPTLSIDDTATGAGTKIEGWQKVNEHNLAYRGLVLIVERDPLGTALIREQTGAGVYPSIHWLSLVRHAGKVLDLSQTAIQREMDYPSKLFQWNVDNDNLESVPTLTS